MENQISGVSLSAYGTSDFFTNAMPSNCSISSCHLKVGLGCDGDVDLTKAELGPDPYNLVVNYNKSYFDANPLCYECLLETEEIYLINPTINNGYFT